MSTSESPPPGPVSGFLLRLASDPELLKTWLLNRKAALDQELGAPAHPGFTHEHHALLLSGDFYAIRAKVKEEAGDVDAAFRWVVIWVV